MFRTWPLLMETCLCRTVISDGLGKSATLEKIQFQGFDASTHTQTRRLLAASQKCEVNISQLWKRRFCETFRLRSRPLLVAFAIA